MIGWRTAWTIARRDLSARFRGLRLLLVCLFLGVGALAAIGTLTGAIERMVSHVRKHCQCEPRCFMTGGAGWKMAPSMSVQFELVDSLIFDGLLEIAKHRLDHPAPVWPSRGLY